MGVLYLYKDINYVFSQDNCEHFLIFQVTPVGVISLKNFRLGMVPVSVSRKNKLLKYFVQVNFIRIYSFVQVCSCVISIGAMLYLKSSTSTLR